MRGHKKLFIGIIGLMVAAFFCAAAIAAEEKTITGQINEEQQFVANDGTIYEIGESDKGNELVEMTGKKVSVTGMVTESEGAWTIEVTDFELME